MAHFYEKLHQLLAKTFMRTERSLYGARLLWCMRERFPYCSEISLAVLLGNRLPSHSKPTYNVQVNFCKVGFACLPVLIVQERFPFSKFVAMIVTKLQVKNSIHIHLHLTRHVSTGTYNLWVRFIAMLWWTNSAYEKTLIAGIVTTRIIWHQAIQK